MWRFLFSQILQANIYIREQVIEYHEYDVMPVKSCEVQLVVVTTDSTSLCA